MSHQESSFSMPKPEPIAGIQHIVAVASGKGGVGKSTVSVNLAAALAKQGLQVGLCDADIYGPSLALMMGADGESAPVLSEEEFIEPVEKHGVKMVSIGLWLEGGVPALLRGPLVTRYVQQFLFRVQWGELDVLILDLPPGTGDIPLTIVQTVALTGAVLVTTPQEAALLDVRRAAGMFQRLNIPILGVVENMSGFLCPDCGKTHELFGSGGGKREAERLETALLAQIPFHQGFGQAGDEGRPSALGEGKEAEVWRGLAENLQKKMALSFSFKPLD